MWKCGLLEKKHSKETPPVRWACDFPVGGHAVQEEQLLKPSAFVSLGLLLVAGMKETSASKYYKAPKVLHHPVTSHSG